MHSISKFRIEKRLDETIREGICGVAIILERGVCTDNILSHLKQLGYWWFRGSPKGADIARITIHNGTLLSRGTITYDPVLGFPDNPSKSYEGFRTLHLHQYTSPREDNFE